MGKLAIIDLGTNTFHLLIVDTTKFFSQKEIFYRERVYVFLGKGNRSEIHPESYKKGIETLHHFSSIIKQYEVSKTIALGTEALRKTSNGPMFCAEVLEKTNINIEIIDGLKEALLIANGVKLLDLPLGEQLVMDIGGGSVEFIHLKDKEIIWSQSFKIGISVLYNSFVDSEPMSEAALGKLDDFLELSLQELWMKVSPTNLSLIGASGTFEVLKSEERNLAQLSSISLTTIKDLYRRLRVLSLEERVASGYIVAERAKYIVVALHLVLYVLKRLDIKACFLSPYAMKEGAIAQFLNLD